MSAMFVGCAEPRSYVKGCGMQAEAVCKAHSCLCASEDESEADNACFGCQWR